MIVALLVLIVLILLFGAAAVKGWIKSTVAYVLGFTAIVTVIIWLSSFFGENGFLWVMGGLFVLVVAIGIAGYIEANPAPPPPPKRRRRPKRDPERPLP